MGSEMCIRDRFGGAVLLITMPVDLIATGMICGTMGFLLYVAHVIYKDSQRDK